MSRPDLRSPRWRVHDYRRSGLYFVTICTADRRPVFGKVVDGAMVLSPLGQIAEAEWEWTFDLRPTLIPDIHVVMPNHVHLLFGILDPDVPDSQTPRRDTIPRRDTMHGVPIDAEPRRFGQHLAGSVSSVLNAYKAAVTRNARRQSLWLDAPLWQGRFHDRVVRSDREAETIRRYITDNPARWTADRIHPDRLPPPRRRGGRTWRP